jgi:hypothetical protein
MKYMVLMYSDPAATRAMSATDREAVRLRHEALDADASVVMLNGAGPAYPDRTTTQASSIAGRILDFHVTAVEVCEIHDWFATGSDV